jgi:hypothetical protein
VLLTTTKFVGGFGKAAVVIGSVAVEFSDVRPEFVAVTVNVYVVFPNNPIIDTGDDAPVPINPPGELTTV